MESHAPGIQFFFRPKVGYFSNRPRIRNGGWGKSINNWRCTAIKLMRKGFEIPCAQSGIIRITIICYRFSEAYTLAWAALYTNCRVGLLQTATWSNPPTFQCYVSPFSRVGVPNVLKWFLFLLQTSFCSSARHGPSRKRMSCLKYCRIQSQKRAQFILRIT